MAKKFNLTLEEVISLINGDKDTIDKFKCQIYKKCEVCGKQFIAKGRNDQRYCSQSCISLKYNTKNAEKVKIYKREYYKKNKK